MIITSGGSSRFRASADKSNAALKEETFVIHAKPDDGDKVPRARWGNGG